MLETTLTSSPVESKQFVNNKLQPFIIAKSESFDRIPKMGGRLERGFKDAEEHRWRDTSPISLRIDNMGKASSTADDYKQQQNHF